MLTAQELNIRPAEYRALLQVRKWLNAEKITENFPVRLNMETAILTRDCGTVACIGGFMVLAHNHLQPKVRLNTSQERDVAKYVMRRYSPALYKLLYPKMDTASKITPQQAVVAIDNFLATGDPKWPT